MTELCMGVLGCADIALRKALPAMVAAPGVTVTAVASRDAERAKDFADRFGTTPVHGYEALLERSDVDAVYVPLPSMLHAEWVERALLADKHVLSEKPLTSDAATARALFDLAHERGLTLTENVVFPHHDQHRRVRKLLTKIGAIRSFSSAFTFPPKPDGDIRYLPGVGGGALLDSGFYPVRAATYFLGLDLEVVGAHLRVDPVHENVVLSGDVLLRTPTGITAQLTFGMEHSYRASYEFAGSFGRLINDRVFTPAPGHQPVVRLERQDHREEFVLPADDQWVNAVTAFAQSVVDGESPGAADTIRLAELVTEIDRTARRSEVLT